MTSLQAAVIGRRDEPKELYCPLLALEHHAANMPLQTALASANDDGPGLTWRALNDRVHGLSAWLRASVSPGERPIALLAESGPGWAVGALATFRAGRALAPLDSGESAQILGTALAALRPALLLTSAAFLERAKEVAAHCTDVRVVAIDAIAGAPCRNASQAIVRRGAGAMSSATPAAGATAVLGLTSGTWGDSNPVKISYGALRYQARALAAAMDLGRADRLLSVLPLHHLFELTAGLLCPIVSGASVFYQRSLLPGDVLERVRGLAVTAMTTVPAGLGLLAMELGAKVGPVASPRAARSKAGPLHGRAVKRRQHGAIWDRFGERFRYFVCGGAPLDEAVLSFFNRIGVPVWQGYGHTEAGPVVALNTPQAHRFGTVGKALPGSEVRIGTDGEILVRGPHVMQSDVDSPAATAAIVDEQGWLHTGDTGALDVDGFLSVHGRLEVRSLP